MDIVVSGRHYEVSDRFREHVAEKLSRLEKLDHRLIRVDVLVSKEQGTPDRAVRVELTAKSRGPVIRAEACAEDKMAALDGAVDRMVTQMRRASDRRKVHHGQKVPKSVSRALAGVPVDEPADAVEGSDESVHEYNVGPVSVTGDGPLVVREKEHQATPMTLEQALYEMELVGHDFFLFVHKETERPSVVYRRRGYDYGVISLLVT